MRSFQSFLPLIILALLLQCQGVPIEDFFPTTGLSSSSAAKLHFPVIATACGGVSVIDIALEGTTNLSSATDRLITFTPFLVTLSDLDVSEYSLQQNLLNSLQNVSELENLYKEYYPRNSKERPFKITSMMTITWELSNAAQEINKFQVVAAFNETKNAIFVLYQYLDGMLQWSSSDSKVSLRICDAEETYETSNILTGSNVNEPGRYAFLYNDSGINPAVTCSAGCNVNNGYCTVAGQCICLNGWMGDTCDDIACHPDCDLYGQCNEPNVCVCDNDLWSGSTCRNPRCNNCVHGTCTVPDVCDCSTGYKNPECSVPVCTGDCSMRGQCTAPETCQCNEGWSGNKCQNPVCGACINGACTAPATCTCINDAWSGEACDVANCSAECMINGRCDIPNNCTCDEGWEGVVCEEPICLEGCSNGFCELPGQCNCTEGFIGELCDSTPEPPALSPTEIGLLTGGLVVFVIICAVVVASVLLAIRFC